MEREEMEMERERRREIASGLALEEELGRLEMNDLSSDCDSGLEDGVPELSGVRLFHSRIPVKTIPSTQQDRTMLQVQDRAMSIAELPRLSRPHTCHPRSVSTPSVPRPQYSRYTSVSPERRVPMNRVIVGAAPSPNLTCVQARIGSFTNSGHRPGGGQVRIPRERCDWKAEARTKAYNTSYVPRGGDKVIHRQKLSWNSKAKIGSLEKAHHRPGGGQVKIESQKLEWNVDAKIGSTRNMKHQPGGGDVKIHDARVEWDVGSRVRSLSNMRHKAGGGDVKIFDDKEYTRISSGLSNPSSLGSYVWDTQSQGGHPDSSSMTDWRTVKAPPPSLDWKAGKLPPPASYRAEHVRKLSPMGGGF